MRIFFVMLTGIIFSGCSKTDTGSGLSAGSDIVDGVRKATFPCRYNPDVSERKIDCLGISNEAQCKAAPECLWDSSIPVPANGLCGYTKPLPPHQTGPCQHAHTVEECNSIPNSECVWNRTSSSSATPAATTAATPAATTATTPAATTAATPAATTAATPASTPTSDIAPKPVSVAKSCIYKDQTLAAGGICQNIKTETDCNSYRSGLCQWAAPSSQSDATTVTTPLVRNSSPKSGVDCKNYNRDGRTCIEAGIKPGEIKNMWGGVWQCVDGCAKMKN
ncbi:MAG: hypothetical protein HQK54_13785 [Oligoflexales bacterium]|nr:hypothetical protein [Oligoflexales bacterium]